ncbi:MAG TPA: MotA/TolQ/ExbB proton channel family protein [Bacteroidales bacterium]|nr:MotA/TolQ/ExbB proton channel family protein [Bacteroidales bacterium]
MFELFYEGGALFMGILSILLLLVIIATVSTVTGIIGRKFEKPGSFNQRAGYIRAVGLFAMITGILGQLIGLYEAFIAIQNAGDISPALVAGGFKVSMITTLYGIFIYLFSLILWFVMNVWYERRA